MWLENPCSDFFGIPRGYPFKGIELRMVNHGRVRQPKIAKELERKTWKTGGLKSLEATKTAAKHLDFPIQNVILAEIGIPIGWPHNPTKMMSKCENMYV